MIATASRVLPVLIGIVSSSVMVLMGGVAQQKLPEMTTESKAGLRGRWEGVLVNSECYDTLERNVNPSESADASGDRSLEVRYCRANARTKSFTVVQPDGQSFKLDATGNARAAEIVRTGNQKLIFVVSVTGDVRDHLIKVDSISMLRNVTP